MQDSGNRLSDYLYTGRPQVKKKVCLTVGPNLAFFLAPLIAEGVLYFASWRETLLVLGAVQILSAVVFHTFGRGGTSAETQRSR
jgi:hypothetical protein